MNIQESIDRMELHRKGFLGPSLKENPTLPSIGIRAARSAGVDVDDDGRMRCPDNTPGAGTFTDLQQSNCQIPSVSKKKLALSEGVLEFKVGLFNTRTRIGHLFQAAGSSFLPGDSSRLRNPVRSATARGLTPGKPGKLGRRLREPEVFRCPPGYEFGGRFGSGLNSCGRRLFGPGIDVPGSGRREGSSTTGDAKRTAARVIMGTPGEGDARLVGEIGTPGKPVQVSRVARIPGMGSADGNGKKATLVRSVREVRKNRDKSFLVRKDGVSLSPSVSMATLAKQKNNKDMDGGTIVAFGKASTFGRSELPVLINSSAKSLALVLPGDGYVLVSKTRKLTPAEKSAVSSAMRSPGGPEKIMKLGAASGGALKVSFEGPKEGRKTVRIRQASGGASREVPIWVYNTYLQRSAPGREGRDVWVIVKDS